MSILSSVYTQNIKCTKLSDASLVSIIWPQREKTCLPGFANIKGTDQPVYLHRQISAFVICISTLAPREI